MSTEQSFDLVSLLASELALPAQGIAAVIGLSDEGCTVPFIARYRKERTGSLDEVQIRAIQERRAYITELNRRRQVIVEAITEQGKMTEALAEELASTSTKAVLEDLYRPYKTKRRTRASMARSRGLEPLALRILEQSAEGDPEAEAAPFVNEEGEVKDLKAALAGANDIIAEKISEDALLRRRARAYFFAEGLLAASPTPAAIDATTKFEQFYNYTEPLCEVPSHRYLALRRGDSEGALKLRIELAPEPFYDAIAQRFNLNNASPFAPQLRDAIKDAYKRLIAPSVESDVRNKLKSNADAEAIEVFAQNLRPLLLAPPMGSKSVVGIDPGIRTGCKCVALSDAGKMLGHITIFPQRKNRAEVSSTDLLTFLREHKPSAIAVGNGTGGREAECFVRQLLAKENLSDATIVVSVNEAGASVYSASKIARDEFPELDLTLRGAISIARRLQDPLAELVKIDPKAIGVGQYQHDVQQKELQNKLTEVVESCVNHIGVDANTASASLLSFVSGIGPKLAKKIVAHREEKGLFTQRAQLLDIPGLGAKTFQLAAGFLRVNGENPLDASSVHPERYTLVEKIAADMEVSMNNLVGNNKLISSIEIARYVSEEVGEPTLKDIFRELRKPGRDPRKSFDPPKFRNDVLTIADLKEGMVLEGVVTNVTNFGAFIDIGVHQDGLIHISELSQGFIKDPHQIAHTGDRLKVRVTKIEEKRKRISLSSNLSNTPTQGHNRGRNNNDRPRNPQANNSGQNNGGQNNDRSAGNRGPRPERSGNRGPRPSGNRGPRPSNRRNEGQGSQDARRPRKDQAPQGNAGASSGATFKHNPFADLLNKG